MEERRRISLAVDIESYKKIIKNAADGDDVRDAIINCMNAINQDSAFDIGNKTIECKLSELNKTYSAGKGKAWKQVTINVTDDSGEAIDTGNVTKYDLEINNYTENKVWNAEEEHGPNAQWGDVIVNVDHSGEWDGILDNYIISTGDLDETGTFSASLIGKTAFKSITFSNVDPIKDGGGYYDSSGQGYFNIKFDPKGGTWSDGTTKPKEKSIKSGDTLSTNEKVTKAGFTHMGWLSNYGNSTAKRSETVYADWGNPSVVPGEISDSWEDILKRKGSHLYYPLGSYKSLDIDVDIPYSADRGLFPDIDHILPGQVPETGTYRYRATYIFVNMAYGEDSTSSWVCMNPVYGSNAPIPNHIANYDALCPIQSYDPVDYANNVKMEWLNSVFLDYAFAEFKDYITPVTKHYRYRNDLGVTLNKVSKRKIWLPSVKEFWIEGYDDQPGYPEQDPTQSTEELYTKAIGLEYFKNFLGCTSGTERKTWLEKLTTDYSGAAGSFRDRCYGLYADMVTLPIPQTIEGVDTTVISGRATSQSLGVNPWIIGFCL